MRNLHPLKISTCMIINFCQCIVMYVFFFIFNFIINFSFVDIHIQLVDYLLTIGSDALKNGISSIRPLAKHDNFIEKVQLNPAHKVLQDNTLLF